MRNLSVATRDVLLHPKNAIVLTSLKDDTRKWYAGSLARQSGLSYVYVTALLAIFEKEGVVDIKKEGKVRRVTLTEKGQKIATALDELVGKLALLAPPAPMTAAQKADEKKEEKTRSGEAGSAPSPKAKREEEKKS